MRSNKISLGRGIVKHYVLCFCFQFFLGLILKGESKWINKVERGIGRCHGFYIEVFSCFHHICLLISSSSPWT